MKCNLAAQHYTAVISITKDASLKRESVSDLHVISIKRVIYVPKLPNNGMETGNSSFIIGISKSRSALNKQQATVMQRCE